MSSAVAEIEPAVAEAPFKPNYKVIGSFLKGLKPVELISVSQWAEKYRVLGRAVSNQPGPWKNSVTPYIVKIMDSLGVHAPYKEVVFMKGTQVAATSAGENFTGYSIHVDPGPIIIMFPTVAVGKRNSKRRLKPLIEDTPELRRLIAPSKSRDGGNTILEKDFPGGNMLICGANSPADLRSVNARRIIFDEIDEYPEDLGDQGDPIEIALKRTDTYDHNKKILYISTPKIKGKSHIEKKFLETDQNYYHVPCPHCEKKQKLVLEQFRFVPGKPKEVHYECIHCHEKIYNHHKAYMLPRGEWIPDCPEKSNDDIIGFHLNAFYSPVGFYSWETMAKAYERAQKDANKMKTFIQTVLGMPYEEEGAQPPYRVLFERALGSDYVQNEIPDEVCFMTAGLDVQHDRIECEVVGWGKGRRSYSIAYHIFPGRPEEAGVWHQVAGLLNSTWTRKSDGMVFGLNMSLIDEGYSKNEVYAFCLAMGLNKIMPSKGSHTQTAPISAPRPVWIKRDGKKDQSLQHINISIDYYKSALYAHLTLPRDNKEGPEYYCHFPNNYELEHYERLTIEKKVTTPGIRGFEKGLWVKPAGARNEQLDCRVYAMAAASLFGIDSFTDDDFDRLVGHVVETPDNEAPNLINKRGSLPGMGNLPNL